jgi:hypothetical protein
MSYTSPNWNTSVQITIDTQNDFTLPNAPAEIKGTSPPIGVCEALITALGLFINSPEDTSQSKAFFKAQEHHSHIPVYI